MIGIHEIEKTGNAAVKKLRMRKLNSGHPFMINSNDLPGNQCYLEYPNGKILLVTIKKSARDFTVLRKLSPSEVEKLRARYQLSF